MYGVALLRLRVIPRPPWPDEKSTFPVQIKERMPENEKALLPEGAAPSPARREAEAKSDRLEQDQPADSRPQSARPRVQLRKVSAERAQIEAELVAAWEEIAAYLPATGHGGRVMPAQRERLEALTFGDVAAIRDWFGLFRPQIDVVRAARNTVVHRPENLSDDEVREALGVARAVLQGLDDLIRRET